MDARNLIETLKARGLNLRVNGDRIRVEAPQEPDSETKALLDEVRQHKAAVIQALKEDPTLTPAEWWPEFHRFHVEVVRSTPDLDWGWLRKDRPELYAAIKAIEDTIDGLGDARLSDVLSLMRDWRDLILQAESERQG